VDRANVGRLTRNRLYILSPESDRYYRREPDYYGDESFFLLFSNSTADAIVPVLKKINKKEMARSNSIFKIFLSFFSEFNAFKFQGGYGRRLFVGKEENAEKKGCIGNAKETSRWVTGRRCYG
jgi:hypothetical protein